MTVTPEMIQERSDYAIPMYDKRRYGHLKATLYLEMSLDYFLTQVKTYAKTQDFCCPDRK